MDTNKEKFMYGPAFGLVGLGIIIFPITTAIPKWSFNIFFMNLLLLIIFTSIARYWYKTISYEKWYNALVNFLMTISFGFFSVTPLLRLTLHTWVFWLLLFLYGLLFAYTVLKREMIFKAFYNPGKSKIAKGSLIFLLILLAIGGLTARNGQDMVILRLLDEHQGAFFISCIFYAVGMLVTFVSSAFLKKTDKVQY
ncbi:hypothetical protein ACFSO7_00925 [Bacillus sp. CGMCC 1.16607]|uniref:hypothetical protein n=1 Tax=Bacillus sp. CGMCC 1.16607 TaxID=3351842 RepID=UPI0036374A0E